MNQFDISQFEDNKAILAISAMTNDEKHNFDAKLCQSLNALVLKMQDKVSELCEKEGVQIVVTTEFMARFGLVMRI